MRAERQPSSSRRRLLVPAGAFAAAAITTALLGAAQPAAPPPASRPALYTDAQAISGEALYRQSCASCHGATLTGGTAPALTGPAFEASWSNPRVTLDDLFFIARTTMPPRASNTVTAENHAAVFAYILKTNGFPSGQRAVDCRGGAARGQHACGPMARARPRARQPPAFIAGAPGAAPAASGPDQATLNARRRSRPTGCSTRTTTPARATRRSRRSTPPTSRASRRRACSRLASATISRPGRSSTTARCT